MLFHSSFLLLCNSHFYLNIKEKKEEGQGGEQEAKEIKAHLGEGQGQVLLPDSELQTSTPAWGTWPSAGGP